METNKRALWIRLLALAVVVAALIGVAIVYAPSLTRLISNTNRFSDYIQSFGARGVLVFMLIQALQVVIAAIPGEFTQLAGGVIYGTMTGTVLSSAGILVGSIIAFYITRLFGYPLLKLLTPADKLKQFQFLINNPKAEIGMLLLFLIPGIPKDVLVYIAGLTPVNPVRFFILTTIARLPGIVLSSFIGAHVETKDYTEVIVASALAIGLFIIGILFRDRIIQKIKRHRHRPGNP